MRSPSAMAADSGFRTIVPDPSLRVYPSPASLNDLQRPSGARNVPWLKPIVGSGMSRALTPPTIAIVASPERMLRHAR
jgi:hypothetical protein